MALATASKGSSSISEYFTKMKSLADEMASAGRKLDDEELISYILTGLDLEFNLVVSVVAERIEPITVNELYTQLVAFGFVEYHRDKRRPRQQLQQQPRWWPRRLWPWPERRAWQWSSLWWRRLSRHHRSAVQQGRAHRRPLLQEV